MHNLWLGTSLYGTLHIQCRTEWLSIFTGVCYTATARHSELIVSKERGLAPLEMQLVESRRAVVRERVVKNKFVQND
jgi:hypothetical protein